MGDIKSFIVPRSADSAGFTGPLFPCGAWDGGTSDPVVYPWARYRAEWVTRASSPRLLSKFVKIRPRCSPWVGLNTFISDNNCYMCSQMIYCCWWQAAFQSAAKGHRQLLIHTQRWEMINCAHQIATGVILIPGLVLWGLDEARSPRVMLTFLPGDAEAGGVLRRVRWFQAVICRWFNKDLGSSFKEQHRHPLTGVLRIAGLWSRPLRSLFNECLLFLAALPGKWGPSLLSW